MRISDIGNRTSLWKPTKFQSNVTLINLSKHEQLFFFKFIICLMCSTYITAYSSVPIDLCELRQINIFKKEIMYHRRQFIRDTGDTSPPMFRLLRTPVTLSLPKMEWLFGMCLFLCFSNRLPLPNKLVICLNKCEFLKLKCIAMLSAAVLHPNPLWELERSPRIPSREAGRLAAHGGGWESLL